MKLLSNIIRADQLSQIPKKIIQTKKIEQRQLDIADSEIDHTQKKQTLIEEVEMLEKQVAQLQQQLAADQENAQSELENWVEIRKTEANQEAERLAKEASLQGFQNGFDQGALEAEEAFQKQRLEMQALLELAYEEQEKVIQQSEPFLLALSIKIAEKVIKAELKQDNDQLLNIVKQALKNIEESEDIVMQVSPEDYSIVLPFLDELQTYVRDDSKLRLIPIANLKKGGCMILTANGSYDVTVDGQLQEIKKQLLTYSEERAD